MALLRVLLLSPLLASVVAFASARDSVWSLGTVDALGRGTHPNLAQSTERIYVRGTALNASTELLPPAAPWGPPVWQVYVQALDGDQGGVAVFEGYFAGNQGDVLHTLGIEAGDIVDVTGFLGDHNGKVNVNTRHGGVPLFEIEIVVKAAGLPAPVEIPDLAACNVFDADDPDPGLDRYRRRGAEHYQAQWCRLRGVRLAGGTWAPGETVTLADDTGQILPMLLSETGDFPPESEPAGDFDVVGIFDQEDDNADGDFYDGYRLWVKRAGDVTQRVRYGDANGDAAVSNLDALMIQSHFMESLACFPVDPDCDGYGPEGSTLVLHGDLSGDAAVSNLDALLAQARFMDLLACFPIDTDCDGYGPDN